MNDSIIEGLALVDLMADDGLTACAPERPIDLNALGHSVLVITSSLLLGSLLEGSSNTSRHRSDQVVICLSPNTTPDETCRLLSAGATSVLPRSLSADLFKASLRILLSGLFIVPNSVTQLADLSPVPSHLTSDQQVLFRKLVEYPMVSDLSTVLGYSRSAVNRRLRTLYKSLGVTCREEALILAGQLGIGRRLDAEIRRSSLIWADQRPTAAEPYRHS